MIAYATEIETILTTAPVDLNELDNKADLLDGTWDEAFKLIRKLDVEEDDEAA